MLQICAEKHESLLRIHLSGSLDMVATEQLNCFVGEEKLIGIETVVIDFSKVQFVDSTGIGFLIKLRSKLADNNIHLRVRNENPEIADIFELVGFKRFPFSR